MRTSERFRMILWLLFVSILIISCGEESGGSDNGLTEQECLDIKKQCTPITESAYLDYECKYSEPETVGCEIEMEALYNEVFYHCAKKAGALKCEDPSLSEYQCLADCYYANIDAESNKLAQDECMYECVYSLLY